MPIRTPPAPLPQRLETELHQPPGRPHLRTRTRPTSDRPRPLDYTPPRPVLVASNARRAYGPLGKCWACGKTVKTGEYIADLAGARRIVVHVACTGKLAG